jgi:hypothetical protein
MHTGTVLFLLRNSYVLSDHTEPNRTYCRLLPSAYDGRLPGQPFDQFKHVGSRLQNCEVGDRFSAPSSLDMISQEVSHFRRLLGWLQQCRRRNILNASNHDLINGDCRCPESWKADQTRTAWCTACCRSDCACRFAHDEGYETMECGEEHVQRSRLHFKCFWL